VRRWRATCPVATLVVQAKLLLFDIDGTLVLSGGAGARAMAKAFSRVFGVAPDGDELALLQEIPMAGRTDTWIVGQMARVAGVDPASVSIQQFHDIYVSHLAREIQGPGPRKGVLPGVRELLEVLAAREDMHLALLTGNFAAGARIKLEYFDLWRYFGAGAFAEDAAERNALFGHALARVAASGGPAFEPSQVVVIGDTPLDVGVAKAGGAMSLAVATGSYDADALRESGADSVLDDLSDLSLALEALGVGRG